MPFGHVAVRSKVAGALQSIRGLAERYGRIVPTDVRNAAPLLHELRLHKTDEEANRLRIACEISAEGHVEAMRFTQPGQYEYQVQAAMEYVFRMRGSLRDGYPAIVASGDNACILHYTENDQQIVDGDLLLIDAGAEFGYFLVRYHPNVPGQRAIQWSAASDLRRRAGGPERLLRTGCCGLDHARRT